MPIPINPKSVASLLIRTDLLGLCVVGQNEMPANDEALRFASKWIESPKMYTSMVLPNKYRFRTRDVIQLTKKIIDEGNSRNAYFMWSKNVTRYNEIPHTQNELIWYPFNIENYQMDCIFLDSSRYDRLFKKHFLFLYENTNKGVFSFE